MSRIKVAVIVGSNRRESINRKLAQALVKLAPADLEFHWVRIDTLPMYNGDLEADRPAEVRSFTAEMAGMQALLFVTPEYNRSLPPLLKNAIDWGSKPMDQNVWRGKPAAITGTSPGGIGAAVGQLHLRQILGALSATVMGGEAYIQFKPELIGEDGGVAVESTRKFLTAYMEQFAALARALVKT